MKMLVSDYDNTLSVDINISRINEFMKNNLFVVATGRSFIDFKKVEEKYNIKHNYLIIDHGATIVHNEKIIYTKCIDKSILNEITSIVKDNIIFCCSGLKKVNDFKNITKINVGYSDNERAKKMNDYLNKTYKKYINSYLINPFTIEITSNEASKKNAVEYLKELLNINDIYTVGDGYSDIEMIKSYNGFAMNNSVDELKKLNVKKVSSVDEVINLIENET